MQASPPPNGYSQHPPPFLPPVPSQSGPSPSRYQEPQQSVSVDLSANICSVIENGWRYELRVDQQPQRARMCGFGDKDRRPITPPPCVRLIITDVHSGKEVDINLIDHSMYVLNVDLWDEQGGREVNLVRHPPSPTQIPAIPATPVYHQQGGGINYQPPNSAPPYQPHPPPPPPPPHYQHQHPAYAQHPPPPHHNGPYAHPALPPPYAHPQPHQAPQYTNGCPPNNGYSYGYIPQGEVAPRNHSSLVGGYNERHDMPRPQVTQPTGMLTRNLIGSLAASAFRLTDTQDKIGIWFVLQDLSVRTEGVFRLRFSFVNVGNPKSPDGSSAGPLVVNTGRAPVLAACFSEPFTVYSAKRFPGVVESTHLSKCFATQGIKIPIRKDAQNARNGARDDEY